MKGIETLESRLLSELEATGSDHCPAMKGIETRHAAARLHIITG